jgi:hypothetical protein
MLANDVKVIQVAHPAFGEFVMNRLRQLIQDTVRIANIAHAKSRSSTNFGENRDRNCGQLKRESGVPRTAALALGTRVTLRV